MRSPRAGRRGSRRRASGSRRPGAACRGDCATREANILVAQGNLSQTYKALERLEQALHMRQNVYLGYVKLHGKEHVNTLITGNNYAASLLKAKRFEETKSLQRQHISVARRVLGEGDDLTLKMRLNYAMALYKDNDATLDDLREAVTTLEDSALTARRVLGGAHPIAMAIEEPLRSSRIALRASETRRGVRNDWAAKVPSSYSVVSFFFSAHQATRVLDSGVY